MVPQNIVILVANGFSPSRSRGWQESAEHAQMGLQAKIDDWKKKNPKANIVQQSLSTFPCGPEVIMTIAITYEE